MTKEVIELFKRASDLPESDRATLAGLLIDSLETARDSGVDAAWDEEIERRLTELDSGAVKAVPWEAVRAKLDRLLNES